MKRALFAWGGWEGHEPRQTTEKASAALADAGFEVVVKDTLDAFKDVDEVKSYDLIVPLASSTSSPCRNCERRGSICGRAAQVRT